MTIRQVQTECPTDPVGAALVTLFFPFRLTVIPGGAEKNLALKTAYGPIPNYIDGENQPFPPLSTKPATFKTEIKVEIKQPPEEEEVSVVEEEEVLSVVEEVRRG